MPSAQGIRGDRPNTSDPNGTSDRQCVGCRRMAAAGRLRCSHCLEIAREKAKRQRLRRKQSGLCIASGCKQPSGGTSSIYCPLHRRANCERLKRYERRQKLEVFHHYGGPVCACCGERRVEFLALDHIGGGGNRHRRECRIGKLYVWLKRNGYPPGFQVLCFNCNQGKGAGTECPHQRPELGPEYFI